MRFAIALSAGATVALTAQAAPVSPSEAEDVLEAYGATLTASSGAGENAHTIDATIEGVNITVRLGSCGEDGRCGYAMFFSTFDLGQPADLQTLARTNAYNDSYPFGRAFVIPSEDGSSDVVGIDYVIDLTGDASLDADDVARFAEVLSSYVNHWTGANEAAEAASATEQP